MKILLWALALALTWLAALVVISRTVGVHSTPGMWAGAFGLPGVVIANWIQRSFLHGFHAWLGYGLMLLINWGFYCTVLVGIGSVKRSMK